MLTKPIAPPDFKFPLGWHAILRDFSLEILAVEYLYGEVVASVSVDRSQVHPRLRVYLISEAPREYLEEASDVLDQMHHRIHERARSTCCICGAPSHDGMISVCGEHSSMQTVPYAKLKPPKDLAWSFEDFNRLVEGATGEDMVREMAGNQKQMHAAAEFVKFYDAPEVSRLLAHAHAMRAMWAVEEILRR